MLPDFSYEKILLNKGNDVIGGIDEVGRGSFAGPVVAGLVVFEKSLFNISNIPAPLINDSKKLTKKQREIADLWIRKNSLAFGIGLASVSQINKFGIKKATEIAFRKAVKNSGIKINHLLIDAFYIPRILGINKGQQTPIVKGDCLSFSIAAGSIVAKVFRDRYMANLSKMPEYGLYFWDKNKGYGTREHRDAIARFGITKMHRIKFVEKSLKSRQLPGKPDF